MGFEIERKSRTPELWELGTDSAADAMVREEKKKKKLKQPSVRKKNVLMIPFILFMVVIVSVCILQFGRIISDFAHQKDDAEQSPPISRSMRESLIKDMVPLPSGMECGRYEMQGTALTIYVSGKKETSASDYIISASFALRLMEEADTVRFVEEDTGREYMFNR